MGIIRYTWYKILELFIKGEKPYEVRVLNCGVWRPSTIRDLRPGDHFRTTLQAADQVYVATSFPRFVKDTNKRWGWRIHTEIKKIT